MQRVLKWLKRIAAVAAGVAVAAGGLVYAISQYQIDKQYDIGLAPYTLNSDPVAVLRGQRLATIAGCANSCHGANMEGSVLFNEPGIAHINAPNLTKVLPEYSDPELVRLLRHGVKRDGTTTWIMPSQMFAHLSEQDLHDIIAYVRTAPEREGPMREVTLKPLGRLGIVLGKFTPVVPKIDHQKQHVAVAPEKSDILKTGEYWVKNACTECHGQDLKGDDFLQAPDLTVALAYSETDFYRLMRTGKGIGDRELGLMTEVGATRFPSFTDEEVQAVYRYLKVRAGEERVAER